MWPGTHSVVRRHKNLYWQKTIVITGWPSLYFQVCHMDLMILSIPSLALKYEHVIIKKLWETKIITGNTSSSLAD